MPTTAQNTHRTAPKSPARTVSKSVFRLRTPVASAFSAHLPMTKAAFSCPSTAAWYRWDLSHSNNLLLLYFLHHTTKALLSQSVFCYLQSFPLNPELACAIIASSTGEAGENPARDRRRKARKVAVLIRMPQAEEPPLEDFLRRPDCNAPKSEYPIDETPKLLRDPSIGEYTF